MKKFVPAGERTTEHEMALLLLHYLPTKAYGAADLKTLFFELPSFFAFTDKDREMSNSRRYEPKWHSVVRNIAAHADQPGNAIYDGLLVKWDKGKGGGYQLASRAREVSNGRAARKHLRLSQAD